MSSESQMTDSLALPQPLKVPAWVLAAAALGIVVGGAAFAVGAASERPAPAWGALLINFLLWTSLAQGAVVWAAIFRVARTTWSAPINRLGHSAAWFLPFSLVVFVALFAGCQYWLPWVNENLGDRSRWLNVPFLFARDGIGLLAMCVLSLVYVYAYLGFEAASGGAIPAASALRGNGASVESAWREPRLRRADRVLSVLSVALVALYGVVYTIIGFDLAMSLNPHWYSALYGAYFFCGGLYSAMAALIIMAVALRRWLGISAQLGPKQFQDLGNLLMAFAMLMTYLFFSQALPVWYENLPGETRFAIWLRNYQPWRTLAWTVLFACYLGPFALLVVREMKENARTLCGVALLVTAAMWLERALLVAPALDLNVLRPGLVDVIPNWAPAPWPPEPPPGIQIPFPALIVLVGLGFIGVFVITTALFLARHPAPSRLDLALAQEKEALWP